MFSDLKLLMPHHALANISHAQQRVLRAFATPTPSPLLIVRFGTGNLLCRRWDVEPIRTDAESLPFTPEWVLGFESAGSADAIYNCMPVRHEQLLGGRAGDQVVLHARHMLENGLTRAATAILAAAGYSQTHYDSDWLWYSLND